MPADGGSGSGAPRVSGMAIGSLVLGLLGCTSPVGLILGIVAILQINNDPHRIGGKGYAIAGIVVSGLMMLLGPMVYVAVAVPAHLRQQEKAEIRVPVPPVEVPALPDAAPSPPTVQPADGGPPPTPGEAAAGAQYLHEGASADSDAERCMGNLKQVGLALLMYCQDYDERWAPESRWCDGIRPYLRNDQIFVCPVLPDARCGYTLNARLGGVSLGDIARPQETPAAFDGIGGWNRSGGFGDVVYRHGNEANIVFSDGHAKGLDRQGLESIWMQNR